MPDTRTNPKVAERLELHFKRLANRMHRWRRWVTLFCGLVPLLLVTVFTWQGDHTMYLSRPIASSHEAVQADCKSCHRTPWQPLVRLARVDNEVRSVHDKDCQQCHSQSKSDHNAFATTKGVPDCAVCHQEHRGLRRLTGRSDEFCLRCHASWEQHPEFALHRPWPSERQPAESDELMFGHLLDIAEFRDSDASWIDKTALHFNHKDHLKPLNTVWNGQSDADSSPKTEQLQCSNCHEADEAGAYMRPIVFERHCQRCHALRFSGKLSDQPLPHEKPEIVHGVLRDRLMAYLREHPKELDAGVSETASRLPNKSSVANSKDEWSWVEEELQVIENFVFQTVAGDSPKYNACQKCHVARADSSSIGFQIVPPGIPSRWLAHSRFDHGRHRDVACIDCHHISTDTMSPEGTTVEDILMPKLVVCQNCHGATRPLSTKRFGRQNCVECHQYHHVSESINTDDQSQ